MLAYLYSNRTLQNRKTKPGAEEGVQSAWKGVGIGALPVTNLWPDLTNFFVSSSTAIHI